MKVIQDLKELELICHEVRRRLFSTILCAGSGHLGGSSSSVELMVALYFGGILRFDPQNPRHPHRDRVLVRGHLGPLRYSIFSLFGWITDEELTTYRSFGSRLHGHEAMEALPGVDITPSGMLGMILSYGVGAAIALKNIRSPARVWVFLGDGEEQEGNVSEAARHASHLHLNNVVVVMDHNKKQLSQPTSEVDSTSDIATIWRGYGWSIHEIQDGHSLSDILSAFREDRATDKPTLFIANTIKAKGLKGAEEHPSGYHTISVCPKDYVVEAISNEEKILNSVTQERLKKVISERIQKVPRPNDSANLTIISPSFQFTVEPTNILEDGLVVYFQKLTTWFGLHSEIRLFVLTGDITVKELARQCGFYQKHVHYIDVGIREQHLVSMAHGISITDPNSRILIVEGDPFIFRAIDQIHAVSQASSRMIIFGMDSGICEARNGPTHQTTGQPGALLNMPGLTLFEPADVIDLTNCLNWALTVYPGPIYLRLHSWEVAGLPVKKEDRNLTAYIAYQPSSKPRIVIVASGFPVGEATKMAMKLDEIGFGVKVVNVINMKELNRSFVDLLEEGVSVLTIYNGNPFVLQSAAAKAVMEYQGPKPSNIQGHGFSIGTTGKFDDLLRHFRLNAEGIEEVIKERFSNLF